MESNTEKKTPTNNVLSRYKIWSKEIKSDIIGKNVVGINIFFPDFCVSLVEKNLAAIVHDFLNLIVYMIFKYFNKASSINRANPLLITYFIPQNLFSRKLHR